PVAASMYVREARNWTTPPDGPEPSPSPWPRSRRPVRLQPSTAHAGSGGACSCPPDVAAVSMSTGPHSTAQVTLDLDLCPLRDLPVRCSPLVRHARGSV